MRKTCTVDGPQQGLPSGSPSDGPSVCARAHPESTPDRTAPDRYESGAPGAEQLGRGIEGLYRCTATLVQSVPVTERCDEETVWEGTVHVFDLARHPTAARAYAWSVPSAGSGRERPFAVMHEGAVTSPAAAVRSVIAAEQRRS